LCDVHGVSPLGVGGGWGGEGSLSDSSTSHPIRLRGVVSKLPTTQRP
jgi:hypothetical protein